MPLPTAARAAAACGRDGSAAALSPWPRGCCPHSPWFVVFGRSGHTPARAAVICGLRQHHSCTACARAGVCPPLFGGISTLVWVVPLADRGGSAALVIAKARTARHGRRAAHPPPVASSTVGERGRVEKSGLWPTADGAATLAF